VSSAPAPYLVLIAAVIVMLSVTIFILLRRYHD
jgi:hypothetical protein